MDVGSTGPRVGAKANYEKFLLDESRGMSRAKATCQSEDSAGNPTEEVRIRILVSTIKVEKY